MAGVVSAGMDYSTWEDGKCTSLVLVLGAGRKKDSGVVEWGAVRVLMVGCFRDLHGTEVLDRGSRTVFLIRCCVEPHSSHPTQRLCF